MQKTYRMLPAVFALLASAVVRGSDTTGNF
jgi:hypothetical protein